MPAPSELPNPTSSADRRQVNQWLQATPGAEAVRLDDSGAASLQADDDVLLLLQAPEQGGICRLCSAVMSAPPPPLLTLWLRSALELNLYGAPLGGCWLAFQPEEAILALCYNLEIAHTTAADFANVLQNFTLAVRKARFALSPDEETVAELEEEEAEEALDQAAVSTAM